MFIKTKGIVCKFINVLIVAELTQNFKIFIIVVHVITDWSNNKILKKLNIQSYQNVSII